MKFETIKAIYKAPGKEPILIEVENELHAFQNAVGGYLEAVTFTTDCCILCDEEGRLKGLPYNITILGCHFVGPILIVGVEREDFCDVPNRISLTSKGLEFTKKGNADEIEL